MQSTLSHQALADDLLPGVAKIAEYVGESERRVRHLIANHGLPVFRRGAIIYSRKTWLNEYYAGRSPAGAEAA